MGIFCQANSSLELCVPLLPLSLPGLVERCRSLELLVFDEELAVVVSDRAGLPGRPDCLVLGRELDDGLERGLDDGLVRGLDDGLAFGLPAGLGERLELGLEVGEAFPFVGRGLGVRPFLMGSVSLEPLRALMLTRMSLPGT